MKVQLIAHTLTRKTVALAARMCYSTGGTTSGMLSLLPRLREWSNAH